MNSLDRARRQWCNGDAEQIDAGNGGWVLHGGD